MASNDSVKKHSKTRYHRFTISLTVLVIINAVQFAGGEKLCNAPKVVKGSSANITCSFDKNSPRMEENLFLEHLAFSALDHEIVVSCQVIQGKYVCRSNDGYQVVGNITDMLVIEIREALPEHAGIYWCGGFKSNPLARSHCRLTVTDDFNLNLETTEGSTVKQLLADNFYKQEIINEDIMTTFSVPIVLAVIITTVIICALTIIVIVIIRCYRRTRKWNVVSEAESGLSSENAKAICVQSEMDTGTIITPV